MWKVDIYIQTDNMAPKTFRRRYGYHMECTTQTGKTHTREETGEIEGTLHQATLSAVNRAMERLNQSCIVHVYLEDRFVCNMFSSELDRWAANGWKTRKNGEIENREQWETLWKLTKGQLVRMVPGKHRYTDWLLIKMEEEEKDV